ncbi:hypothetical protein FNL39_102349 [Nocardia caishijiensis]|uniref:Uncharacterized protein n=1 Tax=Nocardia caishijiensis TaxID=184756 RepID=A0ABQ6YRT2_9NOCA|nr:hypothetical protein FNL39_102349 [Nocardia caishijiensis]
MSSLNSCPRKAAPTPAAAACAEMSAPSSVTVPPTTLPASLPTVEPAVSARAPVPPPNTPPTAPPTAPPKVARPRSVQPNLSAVRSPLDTWMSRAARSTPPSSSASKAAPRRASRAAALAAPRVSMRAMSCLIAIRTAIWPATRAATPATAPTPVQDVANATDSSTAVTIIVPMITSLVCSMSFAPSSSSVAWVSHHLRTAVIVAWSPDSSLSRKVAMAVWVSPSDIAVSAAFSASAAASSTVSRVVATAVHPSATRRMAVSSPSGQSPAPRMYLATHCSSSGISMPITGRPRPGRSARRARCPVSGRCRRWSPCWYRAGSWWWPGR